MDGGQRDLVHVYEGTAAAGAGAGVGQAATVEQYEGREIAQRNLRTAGGGGAAGDIAVGRTEVTAARETGHAGLHEFKEIGSKPGALDLGLADHCDRGRERIGGGGDVGAGHDECGQFDRVFDGVDGWGVLG